MMAFQVPVTNDLQVGPVREYGFRHVVTHRARNAHWWAAACRTMATVHAISMIGRGVERCSILDWYGAARTNALLPQVFAPRSGAVVDLVAAPDVPHPGDAARDFSNRVAFPANRQFDAVLAVDVYHWTAAELRLLFTCAPVLYLVVHTFKGALGVELDPDGQPEGVWYRTQAGEIIFTPSPDEQAYYAHPPCDWIQERRAVVDGLVLEMAELRRYGPMALVRVVQSPNNALPPALPRDTMTRFQWESLPYGYFRSTYFAVTNSLVAALPEMVSDLLPWSVVQTKILVDKAMVSQVGPAFAARVKAGWTVDSALTTVQSAALRDPVHKAFASRFPAVAYDAVVGTATSILYSYQSRHAQMFHTLRSVGMADEMSLRAARQPTPWTPSAQRAWWVLAIPVFLLIWAWARGLTGAPQADLLYWLDCIAERFWFWAAGRPAQYLQFWVKFVYSRATLPWVVWDWTGGWLWSRAPTVTIVTPWWLIQAWGPLLVSAAWEEGIKFFFPKIALFLFAAEVVSVGILAGPELGLFLAFVHLFLAYVGRFSLPVAIVLHTVYNACVVGFTYSIGSRPLVADLFSWLSPVLLGVITFAAYLLTRPRPLASGLMGFMESRVASTFYEEVASEPLVDGFVVPTFRHGFSEIGVQRGTVRLIVAGAETDYLSLATSRNPHLDPYRTPMYPILLTNGIMEAPEKSVYGFARALAYRQCRDPHVDDATGERWDMNQIRASWNEVTDWLLASDPPCFLSIVAYMETPEEAFADMGSRGVRLRTAEALLQNLGEHPRRKAIKLKPDETLFFGKAERCIVSFSPDVLALTAPESRAFTRMLKEVWDGVVCFSIRGVPIHLFYASGRPSDVVNHMVTRFFECYNAVLVSGDDTLVRWQGRNLETDVEKCDACLSDGPLIDMDSRVYQVCEFPQSVIDLLLWGVAAAYDCKARTGGDDYRARVETPVQNATGTTMTSSGNTIHVAAVLVYGIVLDIEPEAAGRALGVRLKVKRLSDPTEASFLKCLVMPVRSLYAGAPAFALGPQLGLLGKICKIMTNPCEAVGVRDWNRAVRIMAYALSRGFLVRPDYPILGRYLYTLRRLSLDPEWAVGADLLQAAELHRYKFSSDARDIARADALVVICARYSCSEADIMEVEALFDTAWSLPWFVSHPLIAQIMRVDYN